ncbi:type ISP restriction/modification enzyme [Sphingomonas sp. Leaf37]|uniref:type ISP restriction/modification enzyme n=1 Tax=Sphingomonas sp. Leaf37 TaxID=2876552 RepID=UPI001E4E4422|nr:type ISP restriction/modification enzyme [Sphingomonas sp. Leaf37]
MPQVEVADLIVKYVTATRQLAAQRGTNESTFYPDIRDLIAGVLKTARLPFDVRVGTSEARSRGIDMPDFVLGDAEFIGVYGEVKLPGVTLENMALSTDRNDQIGRYLSAAGVVLLVNVRGIGLLTVRPGTTRQSGVPVPPADRDLIAEVDLWSAVSGGLNPRVDDPAVGELSEIIDRAVTDFARIAEPAALAKVLARQARDAKDALPEDLQSIGALLDDFGQALGLSFELGDPKGDRFFRGSLIQTAFYSLFAAWILWERDTSRALGPFSISEAERHLHIPFLQELFHDLRSPRYLRQLDLATHLERAVATLNRVDLALFKERMTFPTTDDQSPTVAAITYFYEPFLEAFDPELRDELGVWYTPPEIVRYQVRRVHHLLKSELNIARGLADNQVVVLDPCCGTGAYLLEVARCIAEELRLTGNQTTVGLELKQALTRRIIGFELLTAPFAVAQLQLYILLAELGVPPAADERLSVFLTNALTGWSDSRDVKITFPEMRDEFDASQAIKQDTRVIVVIGNPPYDAFAGVAQAEEADLVASYKGATLVDKIDRKTGNVVRDRLGFVEKRQRGNGRLYEEFGVKRQLLNDLYVRFFRLAEERIGVTADRGVVSFISNANWLTGRSHPIMRQSLLTSFDEVWIDNLNGDKYKTGKIIPRGLAGAGTRDDSVFTTEMDPRGIQPGTAITTLVKRATTAGAPGEAAVHFREYWGAAAGKRAALLASLPGGAPPAGSGEPGYQPLEPRRANRWRLSVHNFEGGYESWPALDELFPQRFQGVEHNRGLTGGVLDVDKSALASRMRRYLTAKSFTVAAAVAPDLAIKRSGYAPEDTWQTLGAESYSEAKIKPALVFPFDQRWLYYETQDDLLNRVRSEFGDVVGENEFLITVAEPRKVSEVRPTISRTLITRHVHERGSYVIPREVEGEGLFAGRLANLAEPAWNALRDQFGLIGRREDQPARTLTGELFKVIIALLHAPRYQEEHRSALSADWAHPPIPRDRVLFNELVGAGRVVSTLLDAGSDAEVAIREALGERAAHIGLLRRRDDAQVRDQDLMVSIAYWGGAPGGWRPRDFRPDEVAPAAFGERTGDLWLNEETCLANVPEAVWQYQLAGYPVLKKWLGYRQADRREGNPLTLTEVNWLRSIVQRIAALLIMNAQLDGLYSRASEDAFTATALGVRNT